MRNITIDTLVKQLQALKKKYGNISVMLDASSVDSTIDDDYCMHPIRIAFADNVYIGVDNDRKVKTVVIGSVREVDDHLGCKHWPNCDEGGCGVNT